MVHFPVIWTGLWSSLGRPDFWSRLVRVIYVGRKSKTSKWTTCWSMYVPNLTMWSSNMNYKLIGFKNNEFGLSIEKNIWTWISIKCIEKGLINKIAFWGQGQSARSEPTILDGFDWKWTFQDKDIGRSGEIVETLDLVSRSKSNIEKINRHFRRDISFVYQCIWIRVNDGLIDSFDFKSFKLFRLNILRKILLLQSICFSNNKICIYSAWDSTIHRQTWQSKFRN